MHSWLEERIDAAVLFCNAGYHSNNTNEKKKGECFSYRQSVSFSVWEFSLKARFPERDRLLLLWLLGGQWSYELSHMKIHFSKSSWAPTLFLSQFLSRSSVLFNIATVSLSLLETSQQKRWAQFTPACAQIPLKSRPFHKKSWRYTPGHFFYLSWAWANSLYVNWKLLKPIASLRLTSAQRAFFKPRMEKAWPAQLCLWLAHPKS